MRKAFVIPSIVAWHTATDILGGGAAGLQSILLTGYGLFSDGGADDMIAACGITPDWIVDSL